MRWAETRTILARPTHDLSCQYRVCHVARNSSFRQLFPFSLIEDDDEPFFYPTAVECGAYRHHAPFPFYYFPVPAPLIRQCTAVFPWLLLNLFRAKQNGGRSDSCVSFRHGLFRRLCRQFFNISAHRNETRLAKENGGRMCLIRGVFGMSAKQTGQNYSGGTTMSTGSKWWSLSTGWKLEILHKSRKWSSPVDTQLATRLQLYLAAQSVISMDSIWPPIRPIWHRA